MVNRFTAKWFGYAIEEIVQLRRGLSQPVELLSFTKEDMVMKSACGVRFGWVTENLASLEGFTFIEGYREEHKVFLDRFLWEEEK